MIRALPLNNSDIRFGRWLVVINGAIPAALLINDAFRHRLGANPANFAIRSTGYLALISIITCLAITPLLKLSHQPWLGNLRRALGLYAFYYALAHFSLFFWLDRDLSVKSTLNEMWMRKYLLVGATGLLVMVPLAVTSTNGMIRRLGPTNWKRLHRLAYVAGIAGVVHFYMLQKADVRLPIIYASVLGALLMFRVVQHYLDLRMVARQATQTAKTLTKSKFWKGKLKLIATFDETPDVRTFRLASANGESSLPFDYLPGQYLNLSVTVDGQRVNRSYTIASSPSRVGHCELTIKREQPGTSSRYMHEQFKIGDALDVAAPAGRFVFDGTQSGSIVMIAGGVGITPLMSKLRYLTDLAWRGDIYFIVVARSERDVIFRDELELLARRHANVHLSIALTRADDGWAGERGRLSKELLERLVPNLTSRRVHVCGPTPMIEATTTLLASLGVPADQVAVESFVTPARAKPTTETKSLQAEVDGAAHQLTFSTAGKSVEIAADQTILEAAEAANVDINFDCRSGICGTCKIRLASGNVVMNVEDALTAGDRMNGIILACQARCIDDAEVEA